MSPLLRRAREITFFLRGECCTLELFLTPEILKDQEIKEVSGALDKCKYNC